MLSVTKRKPILIGNWKMNGSKSSSELLVTQLCNFEKKNNKNQYDVVICPPFPLMDTISKLLLNSNVCLGAQDCHYEKNGPFTGEVSANLLHDIGCEYVILGHSERRTLSNETDSRVKKKSDTALSSGLKVILCIGENSEAYNSGKTKEIIESQIIDSAPEQINENNTIIAYEPIWAIGTGAVASTAHIAEVHAFIKKTLIKRLGVSQAENIQIIYGGSLNQDNAFDIFSLHDVGGGLVGGASLNASSFHNICKQLNI